MEPAETLDIEQFVAAYMRVTGADEATARGIVDILLDPDPAPMRRALAEWADTWKGQG